MRSMESVVHGPPLWRMALSAAQRSTMLMITPPNTDGTRRLFAWCGIMRSATMACDARGVLASALEGEVGVVLMRGGRARRGAPVVEEDDAACVQGSSRRGADAGKDARQRRGRRRR